MTKISFCLMMNSRDVKHISSHILYNKQKQKNIPEWTAHCSPLSFQSYLSRYNNALSVSMNQEKTRIIQYCVSFQEQNRHQYPTFPPSFWTVVSLFLRNACLQLSSLSALHCLLTFHKQHDHIFLSIQFYLHISSYSIINHSIIFI